MMIDSVVARGLDLLTIGIDLRDAAKPELRASTVQMLARYVISLGACCAAVGLAFTAMLVVGMDMTAWGVVGAVVVPSTVVWAIALFLALLRADRRGWHDLVAGTVLVSRVVTPARPGSRCSPLGDVADGSAAGGEAS